MASHVKIQKLQRSLGAEAVLSLIYLWAYCGVNHAMDGVLDDMLPEDIAIAGSYPGNSDKFVSELVRIKLLDKKGKTYSIHNWEKRQPWACDAEKRSERARNAANARHAQSKKDSAGSMPGASATHADGMHSARQIDAPLLSSPLLSSPNLSKYTEDVCLNHSEFKKIQKRFGDKIEIAFEEYWEWKTNSEKGKHVKSDYAKMMKPWLKKLVDEHQGPDLQGWMCGNPNCKFMGIGKSPGACPKCGDSWLQTGELPEGWQELNEKNKAKGAK